MTYSSNRGYIDNVRKQYTMRRQALQGKVDAANLTVSINIIFSQKCLKKQENYAIIDFAVYQNDESNVKRKGES